MHDVKFSTKLETVNSSIFIAKVPTTIDCSSLSYLLNDFNWLIEHDILNKFKYLITDCSIVIKTACMKL